VTSENAIRGMNKRLPEFGWVPEICAAFQKDLGGHLQKLFADIVSSPLPPRLAELMRRKAMKRMLKRWPSIGMSAISSEIDSAEIFAPQDPGHASRE
jgi:hypothetical protein